MLILSQERLAVKQEYTDMEDVMYSVDTVSSLEAYLQKPKRKLLFDQYGSNVNMEICEKIYKHAPDLLLPGEID